MNTMVMAEQLFGWILRTTWQAAVIAVLIVLTQFLLRHRLSAAWRHGLWFLLVARLLMPMTPGSALSIFNLGKLFHHTPPAVATVAQPSPTVQSLVEVAPESSASQPTAQAPALAAPSQPVPAPPFQPDLPLVTAPAARPFHLAAFAASLWLTVVVFLGARFLWLNVRFARRIAAEGSAASESVKTVFGQGAQAMGVSQKVRLIETDLVDSPAVFGVFRKRLLLPRGLAEELSTEELRHVMLHELAHLKRHDVEVNWLAALLQILHWFNPVLWLAFARMRTDRELATDERALAATGHGARITYGETVIKVLEGMTQHHFTPGLVGIAENKADIQERIRAIRRHGGPRWRMGTLAVAGIIAAFALTGATENKPKTINLLDRYPTQMTAGDAEPSHARPWEFSQSDLFDVSHFTMQIRTNLHIECGKSDLGIGHCTDGAVWAVLIPRQPGTLNSSAASHQEKIASLWFRFNPSKIAAIFPPDTVFAATGMNWEERIKAIAEAKFHSSWHAGDNAMIPEPKEMTVDADTQGGPRRFFSVDTMAQTAEYAAFFADKSAEPSAATPEAALPVNTNYARIISVSPADGAADVDPVQDVRIRFDRAMDPHHLRLEWRSGGFQLNGSIQASADQTEFVIPVRMTPGQKQTLLVNHDWSHSLGDRSGDKPAKPTRVNGAFFVDTSFIAANEYRWSFLTRPAAVSGDTTKPKLVSLSPVSGPAPELTLLQLTFDQPMQPPNALLPYLQKKEIMGGPELIPSMDYDADTHSFTIPALLPADNDARLNLTGFKGANGVAADPIVIHYQTDTNTLDPKYRDKAIASTSNPELTRLFTSMKEARKKLNSGIETVQTLSLRLDKNTYRNLEAETAIFKWQGSDCAYADISGPMEMGTFILGCDGQQCWIYSEGDDGEKRLDQTPVAVTRRNIVMADPFSLLNQTVAKALASRAFVLESSADLEGHSCYRVEVWEVSQGGMTYATKTEWWIDRETFLPRQHIQYHPSGCEIARYDYSNLNEALPVSAFQAPAAAAVGTHPLFFAKAPTHGEQRFLDISDGSDGRMSGRIGWRDGNGTTSSGMN